MDPPDQPPWHYQAICATPTIADHFDRSPLWAKTVCAACPVRAECLHAALTEEAGTHHTRLGGIRGGLNPKERAAIPLPAGTRREAIAALRQHLETLQPATAMPAPPKPPRRKKARTMTITGRTIPAPPAEPKPLGDFSAYPEPEPQPAPDPEPAPQQPAPVAAQIIAEDFEPLPLEDLLRWGDQHPDSDVQDQAARARMALAGLRRRHAADSELGKIAAEMAELETRLAELRARQFELTPPVPRPAKPQPTAAAASTVPKPKVTAKSPARDYDPAAVRAWAKANKIRCPERGRVPRDVLTAWRTATAA